MNPSKHHNNWITVGEIINLIKKPIASYADQVVTGFHAKLSLNLTRFVKCTTPGDCLKKRKPHDLCHSCNGWYQELASSHRNTKSQIKWRQNCDTSKWPDDPWEVAKFFMSPLGDNKSTVKDADSTDLSSLLNVLEWMKDATFGGTRRVDLNLVKVLRSEVRNGWAHAPKQEMIDQQVKNAFQIATKFLDDLDKVAASEEVKKCIEDIKSLQANGLTNVIEAELKNLPLLRQELCGDVTEMKEEIESLKEVQNSSKEVIQEHEIKLKSLEDFMKECCLRMEEQSTPKTIYTRYVCENIKNENMLSRHKHVLITQRTAIVKDLQVKDVFSVLRSKFVLTEDDEAVILHGTTNGDKAGKLLDILVQKDDDAFKWFLSSLEEKYLHLVCLLRESEGSSRRVDNGDASNEGCQPMSQYHRDLLTSKRAQIVEDLLVNDILPYLIGKFVFKDDDQQIICAEKNDKLKAEKCLDLLATRGDNAFGHFVDSLKRIPPCTHLAQLLVTDDQECPSRKTDYATLVKRVVSEPTNIRTNLSKDQSTPKSCLPEKLAMFTARDKEVQETISLLMEKGHGIVSIHGGPGFGKSTIAVEVSHRLNEQHGIPVIFSYLSTASTVDEVILHLCRDVGVNPGEDPKSSLIFWLRNIEKKVVLVMDNIEQLLEGEEKRCQFDDLMCLLRKNSDLQLQIITTSRTVFSIADLSTNMVPVNEMDSDSSMELLRKFSGNEEMDDDYLHEMASLCGHVPLALCIAASRIHDFEDPNDLITSLKDEPMEVLKAPESNRYVQKAIKMSFEMLSNKDKKSFVRLSVFDGNFDQDAAKEIIDRNKLGTLDFLKNLINRSLLQRSGGRFSIHLLIKRFLTDYDQLEEEEREKAQELMVEYFLKKSHFLTLKSYSKDGFIEARESLKKDAHNVEKILKACQAEGTNPNSSIIECLARSDIYKSSSRFFYNFVGNVLPHKVMKDFLQYCVELAKRRNQLAIAMNFQCILADQQGHQSGWNKSSEYMSRMETIKKDFDANEDVLKKDNTLLSYYYYSYGRYLFNIVKGKGKDAISPSSRLDLIRQADNCLQKSLRLRHDQTEPLPSNKADEAISLIQLGRIKKECATKEYHNKNYEKRESNMEEAKSHYQKALTLAKYHLGDHELTSTCHKVLGDLFMIWRNNDLALASYNDAEELYKKLGLDSSESMATLLKNCGLCLSHLGRFDESVQQLKKALDIANKLAEQDEHTLCRTNINCTLAQVLRRWKPDCQEAMPYARKAIEMQKFLDEGILLDMKKIVEKGEKTLS